MIIDAILLMVATEFIKGCVLTLPCFNISTNYIIVNMERGNSIEIEYWKRDETLWTKLTLRILKGVLLK